MRNISDKTVVSCRILQVMKFIGTISSTVVGFMQMTLAAEYYKL
jgi:hypothetical protein